MFQWFHFRFRRFTSVWNMLYASIMRFNSSHFNTRFTETFFMHFTETFLRHELWNVLKQFKTVSITFHFCVFYVSRTLFVNCCLYCFKCVSMKHCAAYFRFHWNVSETFQWNLDLKWFRSVLIRFTCTFGYLTMKQRNSACNDYLYIQH